MSKTKDPEVDFKNWIASKAPSISEMGTKDWMYGHLYVAFMAGASAATENVKASQPIPDPTPAPQMAVKGTGSGKDGAMEAARDIYNARFHYSPVMEDVIRDMATIISKHCISLDRYNDACDRWSMDLKRADTERDRADRLQKEIIMLKGRLYDMSRGDYKA